MQNDSNQNDPTAREHRVQSMHPLHSAHDHAAIPSGEGDAPLEIDSGLEAGLEPGMEIVPVESEGDSGGHELDADARVSIIEELATDLAGESVRELTEEERAELDEAARFYMMARGLDPATAQRLLVQAFIGDAFVAMDDEAERATLLDAALAALEGAQL